LVERSDATVAAAKTGHTAWVGAGYAWRTDSRQSAVERAATHAGASTFSTCTGGFRAVSGRAACAIGRSTEGEYASG